MSGLDASSFVVFDVSAFPVVTVNNDALVTGYAPRWTSEMDALIAFDKPFAIVYRGAVSDESAEDYAQKRPVAREEQGGCGETLPGACRR